MSRIKPVAPEAASADVKKFFDALQKKMGWIPNVFLHMGASPSVIKGYFALSDAVGSTTLSPLLREQISLVVGQANNCNYCLAAHSDFGKKAGLNDADIASAKKGEAKIPKDKAILQFAKALVEKKGHLSTQEIDAVKAAGVSDRELIEIIMVVVINIFTNYFNLTVDTQIDFPKKN